MNYLNLFKAIVYSFCGASTIIGVMYVMISFPFYFIMGLLGVLTIMTVYIVYTELNNL
jgi:hypothetical protein